jgi:hypothetical protein
LEASLAVPVRLVGDPQLRVVDLLHGQRGLAGERQVALPVDGDGPALSGLLVELHVTGLALQG